MWDPSNVSGLAPTPERLRAMNEELEALFKLGDQRGEKLAEITARMKEEMEASTGSDDDGEEEEDLEALLEEAERDAAAAREELEATKLRLQTVEELRAADLQELERLRAEAAILQQGASQAPTMPTPVAPPAPSPAVAQELRHLRNELEETQGKLMDMLQQKTSIEEASKAQEEMLQQLWEQLQASRQEARHAAGTAQQERARIEEELSEELHRLDRALEGRPMMAPQREEPHQEITQDELVAVYRERNCLECERDSLLEVLEDTRKEVQEQLQETARLEGELQEARREKNSLQLLNDSTLQEMDLMRMQIAQLREQLKDAQQPPQSASRSTQETVVSFEAANRQVLQKLAEEAALLAQRDALHAQLARARQRESQKAAAAILRQLGESSSSLQPLDISGLLQQVHTAASSSASSTAVPPAAEPAAAAPATDSAAAIASAAELLPEPLEQAAGDEVTETSEGAAGSGAALPDTAASSSAAVAPETPAFGCRAEQLPSSGAADPVLSFFGGAHEQQPELAATTAAAPAGSAWDGAFSFELRQELPEESQQLEAAAAADSSPPATASGSNEAASSEDAAGAPAEAQEGIAPPAAEAPCPPQEPAAAAVLFADEGAAASSTVPPLLPVLPGGFAAAGNGLGSLFGEEGAADIDFELDQPSAEAALTAGAAAPASESPSLPGGLATAANELSSLFQDERAADHQTEAVHPPQEPAAAAVLLADGGDAASGAEAPLLPEGFAAAGNGLSSLFQDESAAAQETEAPAEPASPSGWGEGFDLEVDRLSDKAAGALAQEAEPAAVAPAAVAPNAPTEAAALFTADDGDDGDFFAAFGNQPGGPPAVPSPQQLPAAVPPGSTAPGFATASNELGSLFEGSSGAQETLAAPAPARASGWGEDFDFEVVQSSAEAGGAPAQEAEQAAPAAMAPSAPADVAALFADDGPPLVPSPQQHPAAVPPGPTTPGLQSGQRSGDAAIFGDGGAAPSAIEVPSRQGGFATAGDALGSLFEESAGAEQTEAAAAPASLSGWGEAFDLDLDQGSGEQDAATAQEAEPAVLLPAAVAVAPAGTAALFTPDDGDNSDFLAGLLTQPGGPPSEWSSQQLQAAPPAEPARISPSDLRSGAGGADEDDDFFASLGIQTGRPSAAAPAPYAAAPPVAPYLAAPPLFFGSWSPQPAVPPAAAAGASGLGPNGGTFGTAPADGLSGFFDDPPAAQQRPPSGGSRQPLGAAAAGLGPAPAATATSPMLPSSPSPVRPTEAPRTGLANLFD